MCHWSRINELPKVFWIDASSEITIELGLMQVYQANNIPQEGADSVPNGYLREQSGLWYLMVQVDIINQLKDSSHLKMEETFW